MSAGGLAKALTRLRDRKGHVVRVEVEVDTIDQLEEALKFRLDFAGLGVPGLIYFALPAPPS